MKRNHQIIFLIKGLTMNKKRVTVEMPNELFEKLSNNAWRARLSVSEYVRRLVEKDDAPKKGQKK